jgi:hypothetical protein
MTTFRLIQSTDKKTHIWKDKTDYTIRIETWKGTYELENKCGNLSGYGQVPTITDIPLGQNNWMPCVWVWQYHDMRNGFRVWNPVYKRWQDGEGYIPRERIVKDILQWVLEQPSQEEQMREAYEKDRVSIESTFAEIESLQKK